MAKDNDSNSERITKEEAQIALAREIVNERGLPKGEVVRLLKKLDISSSIIDRVATRFVPYGHTDPD